MGVLISGLSLERCNNWGFSGFASEEVKGDVTGGTGLPIEGGAG